MRIGKEEKRREYGEGERKEDGREEDEEEQKGEEGLRIGNEGDWEVGE